MKAGDTLRFRGPAGAEFVVTVGAAFDERTINARVGSGEWTPLDQSEPKPTRTPRKRTSQKAAPKSKPTE